MTHDTTTRPSWTATLPLRTVIGSTSDTTIAGHRSVPTLRPVVLGFAALAGANALLWLAGDHPSVTIAATAALLVIPGWLALRWCGYRASSPAAAAVVTVAISVTILMVVALLMNQVGWWVGIDRPLSRGWLLLAVDVAMALLLLGGLRGPGPRLSPPNWGQIGFVAACLLVPALALAGAARLTNTGSPALAIVGCLAAGAALLTGFAGARRFGDGRLSLLLAAATAGLVLSFSTRGHYLFGYDVQQEFGTFSHVHAAGIWHPAPRGAADAAYQAMASITVLPQLFVEVCGLTALDVFRVLLPLMVVLVPVAVFSLVRRFGPPRVAFGVAVVLALMPQLVSQLPAVTRQAVALLIFGALLLALFDPGGGGRRVRMVVAVALATGLVLSHYTTTYLALVMLAVTWVVARLVRLVAHGRPPGPPVVSFVLVAWLAGFCVFWNVLVTDSVSNVHQFAVGTAGAGVRILPANSADASLVERWVNAPVPAVVGGPEYSDLVAREYQVRHPWMEHYDADLVASAPLQTDRVQGLEGPAPMLGHLLDLAVVAVNQTLVVAIVLAVVGLLWSVRRSRDARLEVALAAGGDVVVRAPGRISGTAIQSYNAERLYLQSFMVFSVALALLITVRVGTRRRSFSLRVAALAGAGVVLFLSTTQVAVSVLGGDPSPNVAERGEAAERYVYTDTDIEVARWLDRSAPAGALVFVDRYAVLPMWNSTSRDSGIFTTLAPSAVDPKGYVMFTHTNVIHGRARGLVGRSMGIFRAPIPFYDENKNLIYSTASTRVYR
jgi:uncharacterized membrane protein